jgi:aspartyl aminopeptidase
MPAVSAEAKSLAKDLLSFVDASPTPFQVVSVVASRLTSAGFVELKEIDNWAAKGLVQKNGKVQPYICIIASEGGIDEEYEAY